MNSFPEACLVIGCQFSPVKKLDSLSGNLYQCPHCGALFEWQDAFHWKVLNFEPLMAR